MSANMRKTLRIIVDTNHGTTLFTISDLPGVIEDISNAIETFASKSRSKNNNLSIRKIDKGFQMNSKSYRAIQDVIYPFIK